MVKSVGGVGGVEDVVCIFQPCSQRFSNKIKPK